MATKDNRKQAAFEAGLFALRVALLVFVPILVQEAVSFTGVLKTLFDTVLPVLLPVVDKFVHEDNRIPANGLVPF